MYIYGPNIRNRNTKSNWWAGKKENSRKRNLLTNNYNAANLSILDEASEIHIPDSEQKYQDVRRKNSAKDYKSI
jgi:hypothetical protein